MPRIINAGITLAGLRHTLAIVKSFIQRFRPAPRPIPDALWSKALRTSPCARALPKNEQQKLRQLTAQFLRAKSFEGAADLAVTETMRARIALHACLPILHLGLDYYSDWTSIVIYPGDFRVRDEFADENGVVHEETKDLCGESLSHGPVVLSWEAIHDEDSHPSERDLVIHECAHKLDILNGDANGFPPLHADMNTSQWTRDFHLAYDRLCAQLDTGEACRLDPYAAEDPAEFFAVTSETFFAAPRIVYEDSPAVYEQLRRFYRQDPYALWPRGNSQ